MCSIPVHNMYGNAHHYIPNLAYGRGRRGYCRHWRHLLNASVIGVIYLTVLDDIV